MSGEKHMALAGGKFTPQVFNGQDTAKVYFGTDGELTCGTELFSQFGASLFSLVLMFKANETWMMAGQDIAQWEQNTFLLSSSIGCPAPLTLKTINLAAEPGQGINRSLAIWQGTNGVYMSDGRAPIPIHGDIKEYFDPKDSRCISSANIGLSTSFIDPVNYEYHLLLASGTELVYSIIDNGWYELSRGIGLTLSCGCIVTDTNGSQYNYGLIDTGYMERLEYGNDFDGTDITHEFKFGDMLLADSMAFETMIDKVALVCVAKTTADTTIAITHYGDGKTIGTTLKTYSAAQSGARIAMPETTNSLGRYTFHTLDVTNTSDDAAPGFEPLALSVVFHKLGED